MEQFCPDRALPVVDLFNFFEGDWLLSRTINDLRLNMPGAMTGKATITKRVEINHNPALSYLEEGELRFGNYREDVFRAYEYSFPESHIAHVLFSDGRMFHKLDLSSGYCEAEHLCGDDVYRGRFRVESRNVWLSNWYISGPSKELILDNRYQRQS